METRITVIDGVDGFTPDMLRQRPNCRQGSKWRFNPAAFDEDTVDRFLRAGARPFPPFWSDPMHD